jgi:hypothetical protein
VRRMSVPFSHTLKVDYICGYMSFRSNTGQTRIGKKIALSTIVKKLQQLLRFIKHISGHDYMRLQRRGMKEVSIVRNFASVVDANYPEVSEGSCKAERRIYGG